MLTAVMLRSFLDYDPDTGVFKWKHQGTGRRPDLIAGRVNSHGQHQICIDYRKYYSSRLAWLYVHGEWPRGLMDHKNGDPLDNRLANLRVATYADNARNRKRMVNNKSGYKGIYQDSANRWRAQIKINNVQKVLGWFDNPSDAHKAYMDAANCHFGEFARAG